MPDIPVALQMYTVRENCQKDFLDTLARVAAIGYDGVELAGTFDVPPDKLARRLEELNLRVVGNHTGLPALNDQFDQVVDLHRRLRANWVIVPSLPADMRGSADGFRKAAETMGKHAERLAGHGLKLAYHNHAFEFEKFDGKYGLDLLLGHPAAKAVGWESDVYWVKFGGEDPGKYIRKYAGRVPLVHLKDMTAGEEPTWAEVGLGILDFKPIFKESAPAGVAWYIVEQDRCARPPLDSARLSLASLKKWGVA